MKIINSSQFHPSYLNPAMDTAFGEGWYFTDLHPDHTPDDDLHQALWMRPEPIKSKRYLSFEIDDSLLEFCRANVYRLKLNTVENNIIMLNQKYTFTNNGKDAIRFITHGNKKVVLKPYRPNNSWN
jgi:hypothetical protein